MSQPIERRTFLKGVSMAGAAALGATAMTVAGPAQRAAALATVTPTYNQSTWTFAPVTLTASGPVIWQRRSTPTGVWNNVATPPVAQATYTFTPTWRDVGAQFRGVAGGLEYSLTQLAKPALAGIGALAYAAGDGLTDDRVALQAALDAAASAGTGLDLEGATYVIYDTGIVDPDPLDREIPPALFARYGITAIFNGTLVYLGTDPRALLSLGGPTSYDGGPDPVNGCVLTDLVLRQGPQDPDLAVKGNGASRLAVTDCEIGAATSYGYPLLLNAIPGYPVTDQIVRDNTLTVADPLVNPSLPRRSGILIEGLVDFLGEETAMDYWKKYHIPAARTAANTNAYLAGNVINGGYYGIGFLGSVNFVVEDNTLSRQIRNISMQQSCEDGLVRNNLLVDSTSSSIYIGYGGTGNTIIDNVITSAIADGEGLLQAYIGVTGNFFARNSVTVTAGPGPKYYVYCAVQANGNWFQDNTLVGPCTRAYIACEASWDPTNPHPAHRRDGGAIESGFAAADSDGNKFTGNTIDPSSSVELICLADITDEYGTWRLTNTISSPNYVVGSVTPITPHVYTDPQHNVAVQRVGTSLFIRIPEWDTTRDVVQWWLLGHVGSASGLPRVGNGCIDFIGEDLIASSTAKSASLAFTTPSVRNGSDECLPVGLGEGASPMNIGGGHGINAAQVTLSGHGMTWADIGTEYADAGGRLFVLADILDSDTLRFLPKPTGSGSAWAPASPVIANPLTPVPGGTPIAVTPDPGGWQLWPVVQDYALTVAWDDGTLIPPAAPVTWGRKVVLTETYGLPNVIDVYAWLAQGGFAAAPDYGDSSLPTQVTHEVRYTIDWSGSVTVESATTAQQTSLIRSNTAQLQRVIVPAGGSAKGFVPRTTSSWSDGVDVTSPGTEADFVTSTWADSTRPPNWVATVASTGGAAVHGASALLSSIELDGAAMGPASLIAAGGSSLLVSAARKSYPRAMWGEVLPAGSELRTSTRVGSFSPTRFGPADVGAYVPEPGYWVLHLYKAAAAGPVMVPVDWRFWGLNVSTRRASAGTTLHSATVTPTGIQITFGSRAEIEVLIRL